MYQERMLGYYPKVVQSILEFRSIIDSEYPEFEGLHGSAERVINDAYLLTMTEDRVVQWENILGIRPLEESTIQDRRDTIIARIRGQGKLNTALINSIVNAFTGGYANSWVENSVLYVEVTPPPNNKSFKFENVEQELRMKVPTHLGFNVSRSYYDWSEVKRDNLTWGDVKDNFETWNDVYVFSPFGQRPILPHGYTELEYIESNGTQYINTQFVCNGNSKIEAEFEVLNAENAGAFLYSGGSGTTRIEAYPWNGMVEMNYGSLAPFIGSIVANRKFYICQNKGNFALSYPDGYGSWTQDEETQAFDCAVPMAIFALNRGSIQYPTGGMRLYWFKIYDNDTLVRDFVPCINASGEIGIYDIVGKRFYGNSGTGSFVPSSN